MEKKRTPRTSAVEVDEPQTCIHTVVVDCSSFTFIDSVGLHALPSVSTKLRDLSFFIGWMGWEGGSGGRGSGGVEG